MTSDDDLLDALHMACKYLLKRRFYYQRLRKIYRYTFQKTGRNWISKSKLTMIYAHLWGDRQAPNVAYTMTGIEKYVNSSWLLPKGQEHTRLGSSNTFTVTFPDAKNTVING